MKYLIISLFFLLPSAIQCNEKQRLLQNHQETTIGNLRSLMSKSISYNFSTNSLLAVCFLGGLIYSAIVNQPATPWCFGLFTNVGIAISQFIFIKKLENIINQPSQAP